VDDREVSPGDVEAEIIRAIGPQPPMMVDGKRNPDHLRWTARLYTHQHISALLGRSEMPKGNTPASMVDWVSTEAKLNGMDPKKLLDMRTDAQIYEDATKQLLADPEAILCESEDRLDALLQNIQNEMDNADRICAELAEAPGAEPSLSLRRKRAKKWIARIQKVRALRDRARNKLPKGYSRSQGRALEMAHPLRYMVWVGRPGTGGDGDKPLTYFQIRRHHCKMAQATYSARKREILTNGKWLPYSAKGAFYILPPGHGKSAFVSHVISLMLSERPSLRCIFNHAQEEMAQQNLGMVAANFDPAEACGRRNLAMFPGLEIAEKSSKKFRLKLPERQKSPTIIAVGYTAAKSGTDADILWNDDPCDQKLAEQPTERKRAWDRINGTWRTRLRGTRTFEFYSSTMWHHDDPTAKMLALIKARSAFYTVCPMRCGGPDRDFAPLWPEMYPASYLKQKYKELGARLYATVYECNPQPEELRKVKRLAYYVPGDEHYSFTESAVHHLSLDPTATSREKSDEASFVYAAIGDVVTATRDSIQYRKELRILDARQFHATQSTGVEEVCAFASVNRVDYVHAETRSGFNATAEMLEARDIDVIRHDPGNRSKERRLMDVATMLDDSPTDKGLEGAVVRFPGMMGPNGVPVQDPDSPILWLEQQILEFGVCQKDNGLDATTQLCKFLGPELGVGQGQVTKTVQRQERAASHQTLDKMLRMIESMGRRNNQHPAIEDAQWQSGLKEDL